MGGVVDIVDIPATGQKAVLLFWAPWHGASAEGGPMDQVLRALATTENALFGRVQAEECPALTSKYGVSLVPTFVLLNAAGVVVDKIEGGENVAKVTQAVQRLLQTSDDEPTPTVLSEISVTLEEAVKDQLKGLVNGSEVMLFMKGVPDAPRCGFSRQAVEMLREENIAFGSFDILTNDDVRQGLKKYSDWPTYPQLYVKGELVGGLDILREMKDDTTSSLRDQLGVSSKAVSSYETLDEKLKSLINRHSVMLFMKGIPSVPRCGFSRQIVEMLDEENVPYDSFDILQDEEVRQGLKKFSNWPTFPQLYVNGELVGGLDIVKELKEDNDSLKEALGL